MQHFLSYWERSVLLRPFDFAILGAGLIGKQIAIRLQQKYPKARIALVDRSPLSYGASTRNAGFACFGSVSEIVDDFNRSPRAEVMALLEKRYKGITELVSLYGTDTIGYRPTGSYEIFTDPAFFEETASHLEEVNELVQQQTGMRDVFSIKDARHMGMNCHQQCLFNPYEGMLNSGMLNEVLARKAHQAGIIPLYGLTVKALHKEHTGYTMGTDSGVYINCTQLIIANNAFAAPFLPEMDIVPARGQVLITKPLDNIAFDGIFHSDKGYIYFRNVDGRVLIGGGRNKFLEQEATFEFAGSASLKDYLELYLREVVLPSKDFEIDMHWSGIMAMGQEKIPIVKRINENLLACVRMSGMGVALGPVLSSEIVEMC